MYQWDTGASCTVRTVIAVDWICLSVGWPEDKSCSSALHTSTFVPEGTHSALGLG